MLQLLLAATFLLSSAIAHSYGAAAQAAAEAEVTRQGFRPDVLAANSVGFDESTVDPSLRRIDVPAVIDAVDGAFPAFWLPYGVAAKLVLVTVGSLAVIVLLTKEKAARGGSSTARIPWFRRSGSSARCGSCAVRCSARPSTRYADPRCRRSRRWAP